MENYIIKSLIEDLGDMTRANHEMSTALRELQADAERTISAYGEELHAAKARVENAEQKTAELMKRCDRLQEKYDALHEKYDHLVERTVDRTTPGARSDVKISI